MFKSAMRLMALTLVMSDFTLVRSLIAGNEEKAKDAIGAKFGTFSEALQHFKSDQPITLERIEKSFGHPFKTNATPRNPRYQSRLYSRKDENFILWVWFDTGTGKIEGMSLIAGY